MLYLCRQWLSILKKAVPRPIWLSSHPMLSGPAFWVIVRVLETLSLVSLCLMLCLGLLPTSTLRLSLWEWDWFDIYWAPWRQSAVVRTLRDSLRIRLWAVTLQRSLGFSSPWWLVYLARIDPWVCPMDDSYFFLSLIELLSIECDSSFSAPL